MLCNSYGYVDSSPDGEAGRLPWITMKPLPTAQPSDHIYTAPQPKIFFDFFSTSKPVAQTQTSIGMDLGLQIASLVLLLRGVKCASDLRQRALGRQNAKPAAQLVAPGQTQQRLVCRYQPVRGAVAGQFEKLLVVTVLATRQLCADGLR